jgi:hypothetical protein
MNAYGINISERRHATWAAAKDAEESLMKTLPGKQGTGCKTETRQRNVTGTVTLLDKEENRVLKFSAARYHGSEIRATRVVVDANQTAGRQYNKRIMQVTKSQSWS